MGSTDRRSPPRLGSLPAWAKVWTPGRGQGSAPQQGSSASVTAAAPDTEREMQGLERRLLAIRARLDALGSELFEFWSTRGPDWEHGGVHGHHDRRGVPSPNASKSLVQQARHLWAFSTWYARREPTPAVRALADCVYRFLIERFLDADGELFHRVSRDGKVSEVRPDRPDQLFTAFAGTDFWLIDLGMAFLHWPDQRWIGREKRRTRTCNMLESWNPMPSPGAYLRVVTWVDEETNGIVRAEAYDFRNRLLKEFSPGSFARVGSRYELRDMEIRNVQTDSRTQLQFNVEEPDKLSLKHLP